VVNLQGRFSWYELITTDAEAAKTFYSSVMGWGVLDASVPDRAYILFTAGAVFGRRARGLAGGCVEDGQGGDLDRIQRVDNVDATASRIEHLGGAVHVPPREVANVGRFSIFADPQNASQCPISKTPQRTW
jgi:uncharacterized protein